MLPGSAMDYCLFFPSGQSDIKNSVGVFTFSFGGCKSVAPKYRERILLPVFLPSRSTFGYLPVYFIEQFIRSRNHSIKKNNNTLHKLENEYSNYSNK